MPRISGPEMRPDLIGTGSARDRHGIGTGSARDRHGIGTGSARDRHGIGTGSSGRDWLAGSVASGPMVRSEMPKGR
ncbi:hypothetical protein [Thalassospira xiamenensis]|uniref:hypothetical protein n=1 Tax=Thalassospira xiamenensis TaxID=220697 RepID=UPI001E3FBCE1|nr:hypothetical protein [Thalassospira xiamenensis]MCD1594365.1 hypothetical protein [Thalassospira xiamenensis]